MSAPPTQYLVGGFFSLRLRNFLQHLCLLVCPVKYLLVYHVFSPRCPPLMDITLHMLNGYLLASKAYLNSHLKETAEQDIRPPQNNTMGLEAPEVTREELKNALLAAQVMGDT